MSPERETLELSEVAVDGRQMSRQPVFGIAKAERHESGRDGGERFGELVEIASSERISSKGNGEAVGLWSSLEVEEGRPFAFHLGDFDEGERRQRGEKERRRIPRSGDELEGDVVQMYLT